MAYYSVTAWLTAEPHFLEPDALESAEVEVPQPEGDTAESAEVEVPQPEGDTAESAEESDELLEIPKFLRREPKKTKKPLSLEDVL